MRELRRTLILLGLVAAGAWPSWLVVQARLARVQAASLPDRLLPGLEARLERVARVRVRRGAGEVELRSAGGTWTLPALDGWPARPGAVQGLLATVAGLRPVAPRTGDPRRFPRLGVQDPGQEGPAETTWVELLDAGGERLAGLVVGLADPLRAHGRYVREMGGERAWLVDAELDLPVAPLAWVDTTIWNVDPGRLQSVEIRHPDGQVVAAERVAPDRPEFRLLRLPEGQEARTPEVAGLAAALADLHFQGVQRADGSPPPAGAVHAVYRCRDGLILEAWSWPAPEAAGRDAGEGARLVRFAVAAAAGSSPAVHREAGDLQQRLGGWIFVLPGSRAALLAPRLEDLAGPAPGD